ncbi:hypothetical protein [Francisella hispaniensis]|uniref:Uncharacterized protein n=1 Tax=Francisella hispaniensis FSC454 TaxID=1088883 RepID=A0AAC9JA65_9GAMM|nr:hypothetical protein [Francisella hispaniensis]APD50282.1 hypothetical protein FSC454_03610 [Francisella hispaniensis FSC454]KYW83574.1 hypothetical protein AUF42_01420 [Francisella hispaniensis FSC454]
MKKTLTIALLGTIATTSVYADDLNAKIINESVTKYSNNVETAADTNTNSPIYAFKSIAADASNIQANGEKLARGFVLTNNGAVKIPNSIKPKNMYMKDQATAAQGLEKYRAERDEINSNIKKLESQKKLGWRVKVVAEQAKLKSINTKIDILKGIEKGDKAYAEEKIAQFNIVKNITVNGPKAYFNDIAKPVSSHLNAAWDSATSLNYVDYRNNIDMFWGARVALWNGQYNINSKDAVTAIEFNDITNYLTIQTIKSLQGSDTTKAVSLYADANTLAYTVTTLGDLESGIQDKIASPRTAQSICEADLIDIRANTKVSTARNVINGLSDQKAVETILTHLLDKISIGDITVYDLDKLGNNWAIKAAVNAISAALGSEGVLYVKGHTLMLRPASAVAGPVANAIAENGIYKQVNDADSVLFGENACNFTAAKNSNNPIAKAMVVASKQIAGQLSKDQVIDPAFEEKVFLTLQANMFENLNKVLS